MAMSLHSEASFRGGYKSPQDLLISLEEKFGGISGSNCDSLSDTDRAAMGDQNMQTGEPFADEPGAAFVTVWSTCLNNYSYNLFYSTDTSPELLAKRTQIVREMMAPLLAGVADEQVLKAMTTVMIPTSEAEREAYIAYLMRWVLGTDEEIQAYGRMTDPKQYRQDLLRHVFPPGVPAYAMEGTRQAVMILLKRDEFLMYQ